MPIADEKYVAATTFRRSGAAVPTPTWVVGLDRNRLGFWTSSASGKYRRLRGNPRITLQPSDARGRVRAGSPVTEGTARLVIAGADFDAIQRGIRAKYGAAVPMGRLLVTLRRLGRGKRPYADAGVVITVSDPG